MNDKTLLALALAKTLYSEKRNYLETFAPFVIESLGSTKYTSIHEIESFLKESYSLRIPLNTIQSILKNLKKDGFVELEGERPDNLAAIPKSKAIEYVDKANQKSEKITRKQNKLIQQLGKYLKQELGIDFSQGDVEAKLKKYVLENISYLALENGDSNYSYDSQSPVNRSITQFLIEVDQQEQELFESFNDLLRGAVLWQTIAKKENLNRESSIEQLTVYLDTNIVLSLLGLHHEAINRAASQLLKLLKDDNKIYLRVFDKTIEEVIDLLAAYKYNKDNYGTQRVNHVYFFLKKQGYDTAEIDILISELEDKLEEKEIYKEELDYEDPSDLPSRERQLYETLYTQNREYESEKEEDYQKSEQAIHKSTFHDVAILSKIREERNGWQTSFERCKSIFVTNSYRLYSFSDRNKLNKEAIPEVITDIVLTNILWLKNPGKDIGVSIDNILHAHSSDFLIDNKIWRKFLKTLQKMHNEGKIDEKEFALLTSKNQLTDNYLLSINHSDINPNSVQELNEELKKEKEQKEDQIEKLKRSELKKEDKLNSVQTENESLEKENQDLREGFDDLQKAHEDLQSKFRQSEIERYFNEFYQEKAKEIRSKTLKGGGIAILVIVFIYLVVSVLKLVPYWAGDEIWGFDVAQPSFENAFTTVLSLLFVMGQAWVKSYRDSDWSVRDAYWSFFDQRSLKAEYEDGLKRAAKAKFEEVQSD